MDKSLIEIKPELITDNTFKLIGSDWMLITAGTPASFNTMTASWGGFGFLWGKNICFCVIRPGRYTFDFIEKADMFTLSFFDDKYRNALQFCGSHSGRDVDKAAMTGLSPVESDKGTVYFNEAGMVLDCRKLYFQDIDPRNFIDSSLDKNYPKKDYHRMYIGEIVKCLHRG
jgi:flavin reductase (DIM6/NTAB) family NADH-FMN oxidoreductase RutF